MSTISGWGNYPVIQAEANGFETATKLQEQLRAPGEAIAYGNGRSYGDAPLQKRVLMTRRFNKFLAFDEAGGILRCESGVLLADILEVFVPRGWFPPVSPGTKYVTVGGAVAADIHGKNHHVEGSFGRHVLEMEVMRPDGTVMVCSRNRHPEFFELTIGAMGLSGMILNATFRLKPIKTAYIHKQTVRADDLEAVMNLFEEPSHWTYSVAWVDTLARGAALGRSIMIRGRHAAPEQLTCTAQRQAPLKLAPQRQVDVPFYFPSAALNRRTMQAFNAAYYHRCRKGTEQSIVDYEQFFYPLDSIGRWNRIYGRRGFMQYQFVIPKAAGRGAVREILQHITTSGLGSFLAVLKLFGEQESFISFPMAGYTLALDFPVSLQALDLFKELDAMVAGHGGRLYLAKDARMDASMFARTYANVDDFRQAVALLNDSVPTRFASFLSRRIGITP